MSAPVVELKPGVYERMPMVEYLALPAVGSSFLRDMERRCPRYARWRCDYDTKQTPTMKRGALLSCRLLEPETFDDLFVASGGCTAIVKSTGKSCPNGGKVLTERGWLCGVHGKGEEDLSEGREVVTEAEADEVDRMVDALRSDRGIREVLDDASATELTVVWVDGPTGLLCKARIDVVAEIREALFDVKTAADASEGKWPWAMKDGLYHVQAAHHLAGAKAVGLDVREFGHLVVENTPPYCTAFRRRVSHEAMEVGEHIRRAQLATYAKCQERGFWPSYESGESDLPPFYMRPFLGPEEL